MSPLRRSVLTVAIIAVLGVAGYVTARMKRDFWDFEVYRLAGVRALSAEPLYRAEDGHFQFKYWPAFALAMAPFALVDPELGKVLWFASSMGLIAVFVRQSIETLPGRLSSRQFLTWWTLAVTGKFLVKELVNGQTNVHLGVLVLFAVAAGLGGRHAAAGALIGAAAFVKPYGLLLVPWLAVAFGLGAAGAAVAVLSAGLLVPAAVYGWSGNLALLGDWYRTVVGTTPANLLLAENISFATMWAKWIGESTTASVLAMSCSGLTLGAAVFIWVARRRVAHPAYLEAGYLLLLMPLVSPQGWDYVLLLGTPAFVCLIDRFRATPQAWRTVTTAGFLLTSFTIYDLLGRTLYLSLMAVSAVTVGAVLLAAGVVRLRLTAAA
jgi:hypothetical protein